MKILGIETSCDETALALLEITGPEAQPRFKVLGEIVHSQITHHAPFGGVVPSLAKREHIKNLPILLDTLLTETGENPEKPGIDYLAVTQGPGLEPALWTGITFAEKLTKRWGIPLIAANHMEGHIVASLLPSHLDLKTQNGTLRQLSFPALALLISGGHTELVHIPQWGDYKIIGSTRDDAVGEAFDKVARLLELPYPGGPEISRLASLDRERRIKGGTWNLPRPMLKSKDFDFSFSGLKTAVLYTIRDLDKTTHPLWKEQIAREFEDAVTECLIEKTKNAISAYTARTLIVGGGVIANTYIRQKLTDLGQEFDIPVLFPTQALSTDNALMIALAGYFNRTKATFSPSIVAQGNLKLSS